MDYVVKFKEDFFLNFKNRWLTTKELLSLLCHVDRLLIYEIIKISVNLADKPKSGDFYFYQKQSKEWKYDGHPWNRRDDGALIGSTCILKIQGCKQIQCFYYSLENDNDSTILKKRCYFLIHDPRFVLVHYLEEKNKNNQNFKNESTVELEKTFLKNKIYRSWDSKEIDFIERTISYHIKILDFSPNNIFEYTTSKLILIFETYLTYENLKMLENNITIKVDDKNFIPCKIINSTSMSTVIPSLRNKQISLEIYYGKELISICSEEIKLNIIKNTSTEPLNIITSNKKDYVIFNLSTNEIKEKVKKIFEEIKCFVMFYSKEKLLNDCFSNEIKIIDETFLIKEFEILLNKLGENKIILYNLDQEGYNIIHYICALNYDSLIGLFSKFKLKLCEVSQDLLTPYEIAAGKWNEKMLLKLIQIIDNRDNEELVEHDNNKLFYNIRILRSALNIALDNSDYQTSKNDAVLELLLKQIKIQMTVDSSSGDIINTINDHINLGHEFFSNGEDQNAKFIQKYVRRWLRMSQYNEIKKAVNKLQIKIKNYVQRKKFIDMKNAIIKIQNTFRNWNKSKEFIKNKII